MGARNRARVLFSAWHSKYEFFMSFWYLMSTPYYCALPKMSDKKETEINPIVKR
jgi:hypothetical protein